MIRVGMSEAVLRGSTSIDCSLSERTGQRSEKVETALAVIGGHAAV